MKPARADPRLRGRLFAGLGAAAGIGATLLALAMRQADGPERLSTRYLAAATALPLLAALGLALYGRRPRLGATVVVAAAGLLLGTAAVGSADGTGLLWLPGALLLTLGAYHLVSGVRRRE
jgi:peptidoglycan/LPS O-acetylase OafA/YrhL